MILSVCLQALSTWLLDASDVSFKIGIPFSEFCRDRDRLIDSNKRDRRNRRDRAGKSPSRPNTRRRWACNGPETALGQGRALSLRGQHPIGLRLFQPFCWSQWARL